MSQTSKPTSLSVCIRRALRAATYVVAAGAGLFYIKYGLKLLEEPMPELPGTAEVQVVFEEENGEKLSFEEYCRRNPVSTCWDDRDATDFMYEETIPVAVMPQEEAAPQLLEHALSQTEQADQIAGLIGREVNLEVPALKINGAQIPEARSQEVLDKLYEEDLPDDIIDETDSEDTHIYNKKIQNIKFLPAVKPFYFGRLPVIAVVIDDMGVSRRRTHEITEIQAPLTASFLTYIQRRQEQVAASQSAGHEIMIHVPMEAQKNLDVAPDVLTTQMTPQEIQQNLLVMLEKFKNVRGINNHMGSKLTEDRERMDAVMKILKEKKLFFLDSKTTAKSQAETAAIEQGVAHVHRHVFLDNNNDKEYILRQLAQTEKLARKNGYAIAIGHPKSQTAAALKEWLPTLEEKGLVLTPLSRIVKILNPAVY